MAVALPGITHISPSLFPSVSLPGSALAIKEHSCEIRKNGQYLGEISMMNHQIQSTELLPPEWKKEEKEKH